MSRDQKSATEDQGTRLGAPDDQDESGEEVEGHAADLRERGAVARPQAEDPAAVEPSRTPKE
ncbi:hypothetical protein MLP_20560 [Microlunatus phosphovorus NM-1]|jgi:hypothetical protein|uniref:Uncharacterized protein n=1 Tax=Microlunatus phosphovorus (strain ATCC 700054 / DSM 10555 / JCM 9379 / NBRC 101784 / NCIMB 13414 / VKM Ac-1990 / NM-1) TaxID=1032480 RepID=F5XDP7_MICPN|nr:hypothetical protein [Microlunatus phosphovorus]BAK35070.1 hypothetical protein MLP_20560 [Microlunatus phosphovorus NM-1]